MKRLRRLRFMIAGVMIASMAVLFLIFIGVFRYSFNRYYTKLATRAVESEIKFVKTFDMEDEEASEEYFDKDDIILSEYIRYLLNHFDGDKSKVCSYLGISKPTLWRKLNEKGKEKTS